MVEEMMLLANITVAQHTLAAFAACTLLRRHAVPPPRQFEPLLKAAAAAGFSIDTSSSKVCSCLWRCRICHLVQHPHTSSTWRGCALRKSTAALSIMLKTTGTACKM